MSRYDYEGRSYTIYEIVRHNGKTVKVFFDCRSSRDLAFSTARKLGPDRKWVIVETICREIARSHNDPDEALSPFLVGVELVD